MPSDSQSVESIPLSEIPEGKVHVKVLKSGKKAVVIRKGDDIRVFNEICPHLGADMSEGWYCAEKNTLQCRWHGYVFSADDGKFLENPNERRMALLRTPTAHFKPEKTPRYRLGVIPSTVRDGKLFIGREATQEAKAASHEGGAASSRPASAEGEQS